MRSTSTDAKPPVHDCLVCGRPCARPGQRIHPGDCRKKMTRFLAIKFPKQIQQTGRGL